MFNLKLVNVFAVGCFLTHFWLLCLIEFAHNASYLDLTWFLVVVLIRI